MTYDVIVIGGGMGGLTAGALLARQRLRVLLLEQGERTGGYVTSFTRGGFTFDATGAFLGGCEEGEEFYTILEQTGALRYLRFLPVATARNIYPDFTLDLNLQGGFEAYISGVKEFFPHEQGGLEHYFSLIRKIGKEINRFEGRRWWHTILFPFFFWHLLRYQRASLGSILNRYFQSAGIKQVLATLPAHLPPSRLSFLFTATLITKVLSQRVWYPRGGMGVIPQALERAFTEGGGEVRLKTAVERIDVKDDSVKGVITKGGDFYPAQRVVAAINIRRALCELLSEEYRKRVSSVVHGLEYSLSSFLVYLGVEMDLDHRDLPYFTYISPRNTEVEYGQLLQGAMPDAPSMIITIPTLLDSSLAPRGHHIVRIMTPAPYAFSNEWGWHDRSRYRTIKDEVTHRLIHSVETGYIPGLSKRSKVMEAATPRTLERYTANERGATYGLAPTPGQIGVGRPANKPPLKGLYLAGHYTRPSHGIVGAALSGRFVFDVIMGEQRK